MPATLRQGSTGADVQTWQRIVGIEADGSFGPQTLAATKAWQATHGLVADGIVGPKTWEAAGIGTGSRVVPATKGVSVVAFPGFAKLPTSDKKAFVKAAQWIAPGEPDAPTWLATIVDFESGRTWSPKVRNGLSGATGLIQFLPKAWGVQVAAKWPSTDQLAAMSFAQQLEYVKRYFAEIAGTRGKIHSLEDMYLSVFAPKGVGMPLDAVLYPAGSIAAAQNAGLAGEKGYITVRDVTNAIRARLASGELLGTVAVSMGIGLGTLAVLGAVGYGILRYWKGG